MSALKKLHPQQSEYTKAIRQWLSGEITGHLGGYMYIDDKDDHRWRDGHSAKTYYLGRDDKATFDIALKGLNVKVKNLYDLGPGGDAAVNAKSIPLVQAVQAQNYYPIDLSETLAVGAVKLVSKTLGTTGAPIVEDFFQPINITKPDTLLAFMGGTLGNIETHETPESLQARLTQIFSNYREMVSVNSFMLVSFDANKNGQEILAGYKSAEFDSLIRSCIDRVLDVSDFDFDVTWNPNNYQLAMGLRAKHDQIIAFDGDKFAIEKGEFLPVLNSYRYPAPFVMEAATKAGWTHRQTWSATDRVHYLLFGLG